MEKKDNHISERCEYRLKYAPIKIGDLVFYALFAVSMLANEMQENVILRMLLILFSREKII